MWDSILVFLIVLVILFFGRTSIKRMLEESRQAESKDWMGALVPIALVMIFVFLLIIANK